MLCLGQLNRLRQTTFKSVNVRFILATLLLGSSVLIHVYSSTLISHLTNLAYKFLVNSVEEVVKNEEIMPITLKEATVHEELAGSPSTVLQNIEKRIQKYPDLMCTAPFDCFQTML